MEYIRDKIASRKWRPESDINEETIEAERRLGNYHTLVLFDDDDEELTNPHTFYGSLRTMSGSPNNVVAYRVLATDRVFFRYAYSGSEDTNHIVACYAQRFGRILRVPNEIISSMIREGTRAFHVMGERAD